MTEIQGGFGFPLVDPPHFRALTTVRDGSRTLPVINGKFTDSFSDETQVHIYGVN